MRLKENSEKHEKLGNGSQNETENTSVSDAFSSFFEIVKQVRAGCPWDKEQTPLSLRSTFFEESCEAIDAIAQNDPQHVKEELGDVLLNVILIAYMFEEKGLFTVEDTVKSISEKLVRRHPHVFVESEGSSEVKEDVSDNPEKVLNQWDRIKENVEGRKTNSVLDSIPDDFPPILKGYKMLKKAAKCGFEYNSISEVKEKFCEVLAEMHDALYDVDLAKKSADEKPFTESSSNEKLNRAQLRLEYEFGDVILSFINYGRWLNVDANVALQRAIKEFHRCFTHMETRMKENNFPFDDAHHSKMLDFWDEASRMKK